MRGLGAGALSMIVMLSMGCRSSPPPPTPTVRTTSTPAASPAKLAAPTRVGWTAASEGSPCERTCANLHACLVLEGRERAAAATIEIGCLGACLGATKAFSACEDQAASGLDGCASLQTCVRAAWPAQDEPEPIVVDAASDGCGLACAALARCREKPSDAAEECARQCRLILSENQQLGARSCAVLESCPAVEDCVFALPGAQ
jgi:hypothetical protein